MSRNIILTSAVRANSKGLLRPKLCPNCSETNKPESKFCTKCKFVLSFDAYNKTLQDAEYVREQVKGFIEQVKGLRESHDYLKTKVSRMIELWNLSQQNFEEFDRSTSSKKQ